MFEATLAKSLLLKKIMEVGKEIAEVAVFKCCPTDISVQSIDSSHTVIMDLKLNRTLFDDYRCNGEVEFAIPYQRMVQGLEFADQDGSCIIRYMRGADRMDLLLFNDKNRKTQTLELSLIDFDSDTYLTDHNRRTARCEMRSFELQKVCRNMSSFSDTMKVEITQDGITFSEKSHDADSVISYPKEDVKSISVTHPTTTSLSLKYLNLILKASSFSDTVRISLCAGRRVNDGPAELKFPIEDNGYLKFFVGSKIVDDDDA